MTDLHCHILPGIDDGAKDVETSVRMLAAEYRDGVRQVALSSHFNLERTDVESFTELRAEAFRKLCAELAPTGVLEKMKLKTAAEVYFSPSLTEIDLTPLCIEGTDFVLIELPTTHKPYYLSETLYSIQSRGYDPILAHVERYGYVMEDLDLLTDWVENGIYVQTNCKTLTMRSKEQQQIMKMIGWNLIHLIATDAHGLEHRAVNMKDGAQALASALGDRKLRELMDNADCIFNGTYPEDFDIHRPKKFLGKWR